VDEDSILQFSKEDLKDLFDGVENFMLRRRLWKILQNLVRNFLRNLLPDWALTH
jgi:hypothetical protein